ncbi:energy-coupling factor ABC transporter substrate-binding protein [Mobilicoccus pelagius]|uniref:Cobalt transport protein CbiN n=1 Tax=Mobilicoccus pelagius NBRC 104925 TaxID=1089455 RepID=H5UP05_9MICO|nr:cobalt transport protein CbiN [Mobilicoccus pelagius]GAB47463.1 cobalt transport protein CbiN [Mobilicoccus pelagius NBRC 104925]
MRKHAVTLALLGAIVVVLAVSFFLGGLRQDPAAEEGFGGTDSQVTSILDENGVTPWFQPVVELGSGELESGLFAAQAALGGIALGYCVGRLQGRRRTESAPVGVPVSTATAR